MDMLVQGHEVLDKTRSGRGSTRPFLPSSPLLHHQDINKYTFEAIIENAARDTLKTLQQEEDTKVPEDTDLLSVYKTHIDVMHFGKTDSDRLRTCDCTALMDYETIAILDGLSKKKDIYERPPRTVTPSIYQIDYVKKGIVLQLFGGNRKATELSERKPQEVHEAMEDLALSCNIYPKLLRKTGNECAKAYPYYGLSLLELSRPPNYRLGPKYTLVI